MSSRQLFHRYYDTLFASKDYAGEIAAVFRLCARYKLQPLENILEVGCGTGNHTLQLAKLPRLHVTAVDIDADMLEIARKKADYSFLTNITFSSSLRVAEHVDLCVALFNVVNYVCDEESLHGFFADITASLRSQGLFIFDCWNGTAALQDPPGSKSYEQDRDGQKVICHLTTHTDFVRTITTLNYQLDLFDQSGEKIESGNYRFEHRLWTPVQIRAALQEAGLEVLSVCLPFKFEEAATDGDWKIMFVCRKV